LFWKAVTVGTLAIPVIPGLTRGARPFLAGLESISLPAWKRKLDIESEEGDLRAVRAQGERLREQATDMQLE
jgi:hypothetical protein